MQGSQVKTLLPQNIGVLSAGTDIQKDGEGKPQQVQVVNLLVTPDQAEQLSLASSQTHIQLVLRNPLDNQIAKPVGTAVGNLYAGENQPPPKLRRRPLPKAAPAAKPQSTGDVIQVYNGSKQSEQKFASGEVTSESNIWSFSYRLCVVSCGLHAAVCEGSGCESACTGGRNRTGPGE